ncbi:transglutaminase family protein [Parafilimonas sp.]|uniref:transglutaminase family protein n=1 Tax=Parafilimonas sp. TaxID=1969739 RepID=UPI0039E40407
MEYQVTHTTRYIYHQPVTLCHNMAKLLLRNINGQHCKHASVVITPEPDVLQEYDDYFGNRVIYFAIQKEHKALTVTIQSTVEKYIQQTPTFNFYKHIAWEETKRLMAEAGDENFEARQYVYETPYTKITNEIIQYAWQSFTPGRSLFEAAAHIMQRIYTEFEYDPEFTTIATPLSKVMRERKGVCQDFAHLAIACFRAMGLPAKYVSGYLETLPPEGKEKLIGVDASHAWFSVYIPNAGWFDFDPTNNIMPALQHITIGWGRDYADVTPLKGVIQSSGAHELSVAVDVKRMA